MNQDSAIDPIDEFIEQAGLIMQNDHMPRIAGRILGLLVVEGRRYGLGEMAERLQVSKGSVSTNARALAGIGLIRRVAEPGRRQDFYEADPRLFRQVIRTAVTRIEDALERIDRSERAIAEIDGQAAARVRAFGDFYRILAELIAATDKKLAADD